MEVIKFDSTCGGWHKHPDLNQRFLEVQRERIFERLYTKGYVYSNEIYEAFDVEWNPDNDNVCYRMSDEGLGILIQPARDGTYLIRIYG